MRLLAMGIGLVLGAATAVDRFPSRERLAGEIPAAALAGTTGRLLALIDDPAAFAVAVDEQLASAGEGAAFHEAVLLALVRALAEERPRPALVPVLERLAAHEARTLAGHPENAAHGIPAFPVAAAARGTLNRWALEDARDEAAAALAAGDPGWFEARGGERWQPHEVAGLRLALDVAAPDAVASVLPALEVLWARRPELARSASAAARALGDSGPLAVALRGPGADRLLPDLARLDAFVGEHAAIAFWSALAAASTASEQATRELEGEDPVARGPLAEGAAEKARSAPDPGGAFDAPAVTPGARSVALVELARRGIEGPALEALTAPGSDAEIGSAAALALARGGRVASLAAVLLDRDARPSARRYAALGLRIDGSPVARAALARAAAADDLLAEELRPWLD